MSTRFFLLKSVFHSGSKKKVSFAFDKPFEKEKMSFFWVLIINIRKDGVLKQNQIEQYHCIIRFALPQHPQITVLITEGKITSRPLSLPLIIKMI